MLSLNSRCQISWVRRQSSQDGFSGNVRVNNLRVGARRPNPGPLKNYLSTYMIPTSRQSASGAIVPSIPEGLWYAFPAYAGLTGSAGINLDDSPAGAFCLVGEHRYKTGPTSVVNGLRQLSGREFLNVEGLNCYRSVLVNQLSRFFVQEIRTLITNMGMSALKQQDSLAPTAATSLPPCNPPLTAPQSRLCLAVVARIFNTYSIRQHSKRTQSNVYASAGVRSSKRIVFHFHIEASKPTFSIALDRDRLNLAFERAVQLNSYVPGSLHADLPRVEQADTAPCTRVHDTVVPEKRLESGKSNFSHTQFDSTKERPKRPVEFTQNFLSAGIVGKGQAPVYAHRLNLSRLIVVVDRLTTGLPCSDALFESGIVKAASLLELSCKELSLSFRGVESVFMR